MALNFSTLIGVAPAGAFGTTLNQTATAAAARTALQLSGLLDDGTTVVTSARPIEVAPASGGASVRLNKVDDTQGAGIVSKVGGVNRWNMSVGDTGATCDFNLFGYNDAGTVATSWLNILRSNGRATFNAAVVGNSAGTTKFQVNKATEAGSNQILSTTNLVSRWTMDLASGTTSDFVLTRFNDAGASLGAPLTVVRATGAVYFGGDVVSNGTNLIVNSNGSFVSSATHLRKSTDASGTNVIYGQVGTGTTRWAMELGNLNTSDFLLSRYNDAGVSQGQVIGIQRNNGTINLYGAVQCLNGLTVAAGSLSITGGLLAAGLGINTRAGSSGGYGANTYNINYVAGTGVQLWIDSTLQGVFQYTSDERVKHKIKDIDFATDSYKKIRTITYHYRDDVGPLFLDNGVAMWGFSAQNLLDVLPAAVQGDVTAVHDDGRPNPAVVMERPILAVTVAEVQKLIEQVEMLTRRVNQLEGML